MSSMTQDELKQRVAADSRSARHGAQTTAGVGIPHDGTSGPTTP